MNAARKVIWWDIAGNGIRRSLVSVQRNCFQF